MNHLTISSRVIIFILNSSYCCLSYPLIWILFSWGLLSKLQQNLIFGIKKIEIIYNSLQKIKKEERMNYNETNQCAYSLARSQINNRSLKTLNPNTTLKPNSNLIKSVAFFESRLSQFEDDIKEVRAETLQVNALVGMLQQQSNVKTHELQSRLSSNINTFYQDVFLKQIQTTKNRSEDITQQTVQLSSKYQDMQQHIHDLSKKLSTLQECLGYYNGKEHLHHTL